MIGATTTVRASLLAAIFVFASNLSADARATFVTFDVPGATITAPSDINPSGTVTGTYFESGVPHGFLRTSDGTIVPFDVHGDQTNAVHLNKNGVVIGNYTDPNTGVCEGFIRDGEGKLKVFDGEKGGGSECTLPAGINDAGAIVGSYYDQNGKVHGFMRSRGGAISDFDPSGSTRTETAAINNRGFAAGHYLDVANVYHGFLRSPHGRFVDFDVPDAGKSAFQGTLPQSLNSKGWIVGVYIDSANMAHAFVREPAGSIKTFDARDARGTGASDINNVTTITGGYGDTSRHAYVRSSNGRIKEFDAPGAGSGSNQGTEALAINDNGLITGDYVDANNVGHGYIRFP